jgi:hypothetical protein
MRSRRGRDSAITALTAKAPSPYHTPSVRPSIGPLSLVEVMSWNGVGRPALARARRWRVFTATTTGVAAVLLAASCHPSSNRIALDNSSNGHTISVVPGDKIDTTLQTIGPGQYDTPTVSSGSIRYLGESSAGIPNPGGPRQLFRFEAIAVGRAEITIPHTMDPPSLQTPPFAITVDVR